MSPKSRTRLGGVRQSEKGSALGSSFMALTSQARSDTRIQTIALNETGAPIADLPTCGASGRVPVGSRVEFRCPLPVHLRPAQALLFEQDSRGVVSLLSHGALLAGDVWYANEVLVPRRDALLQKGGPVGSLRLTVPGKSVLVLVCCRERHVRLDKLPLFTRTNTWEAPGPLESEPTSDADLDQLVQLLARSPAQSWAVLNGRVIVGLR